MMGIAFSTPCDNATTEVTLYLFVTCKDVNGGGRCADKGRHLNVKNDNSGIR